MDPVLVIWGKFAEYGLLDTAYLCCNEPPKSESEPVPPVVERMCWELFKYHKFDIAFRGHGWPKIAEMNQLRISHDSVKEFAEAIGIRPFFLYPEDRQPVPAPVTAEPTSLGNNKNPVTIRPRKQQQRGRNPGDFLHRTVDTFEATENRTPTDGEVWQAIRRGLTADVVEITPKTVKLYDGPL